MNLFAPTGTHADAKLARKLYDPAIPHASTRDGYGDGIVQAAEKDERIVVLCADLTESTRNVAFKERFPERFVQIGVQEQLLAATAAGFALAGRIPFVTSYAMFCPGRAWEQVRTNICLNDANVKIAGSHAGVSVGPDGSTHQALEDIALMRVLPNMTVLAPCDAVEARKATLAAASMKGPCYIRYAREATPVFTTPKTPFRIGKAEIFRPGKDVAVIACGPLVHSALLAAEELRKEENLDVMVVDCHTVKPLDAKTIVKAAETCGAIVMVEEHQVAGGLGSAVAELLASKHPTPIEFIGIHDRFGESGTPKELLAHFGMDVPAIKKAIRTAFARKRPV